MICKIYVKIVKSLCKILQKGGIGLNPKIMKIDRYKYDGKKKYKSKDFSTNETGEFKEKFDAMELFYENLNRINELQQSLYAERKEGVVFIFQAMDAAGKDGAIRAVWNC